MVFKDENSFFKGLKDGLTPEMVNLPRQSFPDVFIPDGYIDIVKPSTIKNQELYMVVKCLLLNH